MLTLHIYLTATQICKWGIFGISGSAAHHVRIADYCPVVQFLRFQLREKNSRSSDSNLHTTAACMGIPKVYFKL